MTDHTPFSLGSESPSKDVVIDSGVQITAPDSGLWLSVDLPSMGLAGYPAAIKVRKLGPMDFARLGAAKKAESYSMTVTAIGATIMDAPVQLLTHGDFDFLMYWHGVNSLMKTPLTITWRSRYGFDNKLTVDKSTRKTQSIEDAEAVRAMQAKGYDFSRVCDEIWRLHHTDINNFSDETEVLYDLATWVKVADPLNMDSKIAAIKAMDNLDFYEGLDEWRSVASHGVTDTVVLTCQHFKPEEAIENVTRSIAIMDAATAIGEYDEAVRLTVNSLIEELGALRKLEQAGKIAEATPVEEVVRIPLDVSNFFPILLRP